MLIESSGDAGDENRRNKNCRENERQRNHGAGDFLHGFQRGFFRGEACFDVAFRGFHHHDGVVHHETDGEHQTEKRKRVQRKSENRKKGECADERYRHGEQWNQRRAPALEKNKNHEDHEHQRDDQRAHDVVHAFRNRQCRVERNRVIQIHRKTLFELGHELEHFLFVFQRIGTRQLINGENRGGLAVQPTDNIVKLCAQFHARHVFQAHDGTIVVFADDDVAKFFFRDEPPLRGDGIGEFLAGRRGRPADLPGGIHRVLCIERADEVVDREI